MAEPSGPNAPRPVVVIGGGFAGVAAAWAAARAGAHVVLVHASAGASALYSGIVDGSAPDAELRELARRLGLLVDVTPRAVATRQGVIRNAIGRDSALLDLDKLAGRRIAVADVGRDDFDAELLTRSFAASEWAVQTNTQFSCVRVAALQSGAERRVASYDLAVSFDAPERVRALASSVAASNTAADGWLFGPWLGIETPAFAELSQLLGRPVGEVSSPLAGAAGARFDVHRRELLRELDVEVRESLVLSINTEGAGLCIALEHGERLGASAVVLAIGGVAGGGIELAPADPKLYRAARLSLIAPTSLELDGEIFDGTSSLSGLSLQTAGLGALERLGVRADESGALCPKLALFGAGDVLAGRRRDVMAALSSGVQAGKRAASAGQSTLAAPRLSLAR